MIVSCKGEYDLWCIKLVKKTSFLSKKDFLLVFEVRRAARKTRRISVVQMATRIRCHLCSVSVYTYLCVTMSKGIVELLYLKKGTNGELEEMKLFDNQEHMWDELNKDVVDILNTARRNIWIRGDRGGNQSSGDWRKGLSCGDCRRKAICFLCCHTLSSDYSTLDCALYTVLLLIH